MTKFIYFIFVICLLTGCSTGKNEQPAQAPVEPAVYSPGLSLPYTLEMSGVEEGEDIIVTLTIHYQKALEIGPLLTIEPIDDTEVVNMSLMTRLSAPKEAGDVTKTIRLRGTTPAIEVTLSESGDGFAFEMHESYPPKPETKRQSVDPRTPLPAPIEIEGVEIDKGIEIN